MDFIKHGTKIVSPFDALSNFPIDTRTVVEEYDDLNSLENIYDGLISFVKNEKAFYKYAFLCRCHGTHKSLRQLCLVFVFTIL